MTTAALIENPAAEVIERLRVDIEAMAAHGRQTVQAAWQAGRRLAELRALVPHGLWRSTLRDLGIAKTTAHRLMQLGELETSQLGTFDAVQPALARLAEKRRRTAAQERLRHATGEPSEDVALHVAPCAELAAHVDAGTVDAILTDPPYQASDLGAFEELRDFAIEALKPGGLLACLSGDMYLPQALQALMARPELVYRWRATYVMPGANSPVYGRRVFQGAKPILLFHRAGAPMSAHPMVCDTFTCPALKAQEATLHRWQQQQAGWQLVVDRFALPGQLVADPFLGSGTTAVCAVARGCAFLGGDVDAACVETTRRRVATMGSGSV